MKAKKPTSEAVKRTGSKKKPTSAMYKTAVKKAAAAKVKTSQCSGLENAARRKVEKCRKALAESEATLSILEENSQVAEGEDGYQTGVVHGLELAFEEANRKMKQLPLFKEEKKP